MSNQKTSKYIFKLFLLSLGLSLSLPLLSQDDTLRITGLRLGVDISRFALIPFRPEIMTYEFSGDLEIKDNLYLVAEGGWANVNLNDTAYNYKGSGVFSRVGVDHNMMQLENRQDYTMGFIGARYGFSFFSDKAENVRITDSYWGDYTGNIPVKSRQAHWLELAAGIRAELFRNFFIGWSARGRIMLYKSGSDQMIPYYIPGFGNPAKKFAWDVNYSIYYRIPIWKK